MPCLITRGNDFGCRVVVSSSHLPNRGLEDSTTEQFPNWSRVNAKNGEAVGKPDDLKNVSN